MTKCENEPKVLGTDKVTTQEISVHDGNGQFAGKAFEDGLALGWLACAIESEGSIQLAWSRGNGYLQLAPRVNLANNAQEFLEKANALFGGRITRKQFNGVAYLVWSGFKRTKRVLELILPYMIIERKIEIAKMVLEFINYRLSVNPHVQYGPKEKALFLKVRELNGKGRIAKQELKFRFEESSETTRHASTLKVE